MSEKHETTLKDARNEIAVEVMRLVNFLQHNQLVQAHAVVIKIENTLNEIIVKDPAVKAEDHPFWRVFKTAHLIKSYVLSGKSGDALREAKNLSNMI